MIKYWLTFIFLCVVSFIEAQSKLADSLYSAGNITLAKIEYERIVFTYQNELIRSKALLNKTKCLKQQLRFDEAYQNLLRANLFTSSDSLNNEIRYQAVLTSYLASRYNDAHNQFLQMQYYVKDQVLIDRAALINWLSLNSLLRWDDAKIQLSDLNSRYHLDLNIEQLYSKKNIPKIRDVRKQQWVTTLLPGFVLLREKEVLSGIVSILLRTGSAAFTYLQFADKMYFNAIMSGGIYYLTYTGSTEHAVEAIINNNANKLNKYQTFLSGTVFEKLKSKKNPLYSSI